MASGVLPAERPSIERRGLASDERDLVVKNPVPADCTICGEPGSQVALFYVAGQVVWLHAACEALWQQECAPLT